MSEVAGSDVDVLRVAISIAGNLCIIFIATAILKTNCRFTIAQRVGLLSAWLVLAVFGGIGMINILHDTYGWF